MTPGSLASGSWRRSRSSSNARSSLIVSPLNLYKAPLRDANRKMIMSLYKTPNYNLIMHL